MLGVRIGWSLGVKGGTCLKGRDFTQFWRLISWLNQHLHISFFVFFFSLSPFLQNFNTITGKAWEKAGLFFSSVWSNYKQTPFPLSNCPLSISASWFLLKNRETGAVVHMFRGRRKVNAWPEYVIPGLAHWLACSLARSHSLRTLKFSGVFSNAKHVDVNIT